MKISDPMRVGHAAAIALTLFGWILMVPSIDCARRGLVKETPLSEWEQMDRFTSEAACLEYKATVIEAEKPQQGNPYADRYFSAVCVPEGDPRLKGS
jgi:hypothetical protein